MQTRTFLFSDLRDYTRFVETHGDAATKTLISDYRAIVRGEVAKHEGAEVKTEGDSFYVVFGSARQALACAMAIVREADRYSRVRPDRPLRVGVGIHAGEPEPHEGQFVGAAVIVAARLAQTAAAGEILITDVVRAIIPRDALPPLAEREGITLKGISEPPRVFAVDWQQIPEPARPAAPTAAVEAAPPQGHQVLCPEVVGRDTELAALDALLTDVIAAKGRVALVGGDAGLGKSALLRRFLEMARSRGARVLVGECTEVEARRPFGPVIDALGAAGLTLPDALRQGGPGAQPVAESETYRVHAGFASALEDAAVTAPVVFAIEDLHWGDPATLELVPYLARKLRADRVLLIATYRTDELHRRHPINHVLAELARGRLSTEIRLKPLSEDEAAAVIKAALGLQRAPTSAFRRAIQDRCAGNPFFIEEVLASLVERGDLEYRSGAWRRSKEVHELTLPVSVRDAVEQRLAALSAQTLRAIHVASVIGQRFDFELLREVSEMTERELLDSLREAVDAQLVQEESNGDEAYRFRHALTREAVLEELMARERRILHRRVAETIEARPDARGHVEELAYHFDEARDAERARRYHELAAEHAERAFAWSAALAHRERALELMPDDDAGLADAQLRLAQSAFAAGEFTRASRAAEEAKAAFDARGDVRRAAAARIALGYARGYMGDMAAERKLADEVIAALEPLGPSRELAMAYASRSRRAMLDREADAVAIGRKSMEIADAIGDTESWVRSAINVGSAMNNLTREQEGITLLRKALAVAQQHELVLLSMTALNNLVVALNQSLAPIPEIDQAVDDFLAHARRYGLRGITIGNWKAIPAFRDGDWDRALAAIDEERDESIFSAGRELTEAVIRTARDGPEVGLPLLEEPRGRALATGEPQSLVGGATWPAVAHYLAGDDRAALDMAAPLLKAAENIVGIGGLGPRVGIAVAILAALHLRDEDAIERFAAVGSKSTGGSERDPSTPIRELSEAARAALRGDAASAIDGLASGADPAEKNRGFLMASFIRLERARLLAESGRRDEAAKELERGRAFFQKAKATWYLGRIAEWARSSGIDAAVSA